MPQEQPPAPEQHPPPSKAYSTPFGETWHGESLELLRKLEDDSVNLVITSPPFALLRTKAYGNKDQAHYIEWLAQFARLIHRKLRDDGSFVLDLGGAYQRGTPTRSLYNFRVPIHFCDELGFKLAQDFYWFNPATLPGPIEWVNKRKVRAKNAVNTIWWFGKTESPKADVRNVRVQYSAQMRKLLENPQAYYKPGTHPSGHAVSTSFGNDNGGAIPSNLLEMPNTESGGSYLRHCKTLGIAAHPARFPAGLPEFFVRFLTSPGDLVVDIFAGSNTTGAACERLKRRWLAFEREREYVAASLFRFLDVQRTPSDRAWQLHQMVVRGGEVSTADEGGMTGAEKNAKSAADETTTGLFDNG